MKWHTAIVPKRTHKPVAPNEAVFELLCHPTGPDEIPSRADLNPAKPSKSDISKTMGQRWPAGGDSQVVIVVLRP
jgi:hypothetical protein